jgi:hypothetical protein
MEAIFRTMPLDPFSREIDYLRISVIDRCNEVADLITLAANSVASA